MPINPLLQIPNIKENLPKIKEIIFNKNVEIFFVPSVELKQIVANGLHPMCSGMPKDRKSEILSGHGIRIQKKMIIDWIEGKLDEKNALILSLGDVRVIDSSMSLISSGGQKTLTQG